jgi:hypothetical protein
MEPMASIQPAPAESFSLGDFFGGLQSVDLESEAMLSDDIDVWRSAIRYKQERSDWSFEAGLSTTDYTLDYQPFSLFGGFPISLDETTWQADLTVAHRIGDSLEGSLTLSGYEGFPDYRSIWIAEYYAPDPRGWSVTGGMIWDPAIGTRLGIDLTYGRDTIAPGWTFGAPGNDLLESRIVALRWEQAVNPRLKTETALLYNDISDRDPRLHLQSSWTAALTDDLTLRVQFGGAAENPDFEALYGGLSLDYQITSEWSATCGGRLYDDTGEIESSGFNTAAPGVETIEFGASLLYDTGEHAVRLGLSCYETSHDPVDLDNSFFANLYHDRDWWTIRLAYTANF